MKYNNIKKILRKQVENNVKALWTFDEPKKEFTNIYKSYTDELTLYTPQQLIDYLNEIHLQNVQNDKDLT